MNTHNYRGHIFALPPGLPESKPGLSLLETLGWQPGDTLVGEHGQRARIVEIPRVIQPSPLILNAEGKANCISVDMGGALTRTMMTVTCQNWRKV